MSLVPRGTFEIEPYPAAVGWTGGGGRRVSRGGMMLSELLGMSVTGGSADGVEGGESGTTPRESERVIAAVAIVRIALDWANGYQ